MKKLPSLLLILLLFGCSAKKEDFYNLTFEDTTVVVGYDKIDVLNGLHVNKFSSSLNKKEEEILDYIEIYVKDLEIDEILLDKSYLGKSVKNACTTFEGELINKNGVACVLHKKVKDKENIVVLYGDVLDDDINIINRIEISYK